MANELTQSGGEGIQSLILTLRGQRVMLDSDLARIYGVTTGFGDSAHRQIAPGKAAALQQNMLRFLGAGTGQIASPEVTRATMLFRANCLAKGNSGVRLELVERLRRVAARHDRGPGEVAIAWVLNNPAITGAIVGARNANQVEGIMRAGELKLSAEEIHEIEGAAAAATA